MTTSRLQLALNVIDLEEATRFYRNFFGVEPAKRRARSANFAIADPPLKLVLFENPTATSALNHLGVEAASADDVAVAAAIKPHRDRPSRRGRAERPRSPTIGPAGADRTTEEVMATNDPAASSIHMRGGSHD